VFKGLIIGTDDHAFRLVSDT